MSRVVALRDRPDWLDRIARWHFAEWSGLYPGETLADFRSALRATMGDELVPATWVLEQDGEVVGTASVIEHDMETNLDLTPWLANVFVHPEFRGRGLGAALVRRVQDAMRDSAVPVLYLFTEDSRGFYERLGWEPFREEIYQGRPVSIMRYRAPGHAP